MAAVLKTAMGGDTHRGFESHTLRPSRTFPQVRAAFRPDLRCLCPGLGSHWDPLWSGSLSVSVRNAWRTIKTPGTGAHEAWRYPGERQGHDLGMGELPVAGDERLVLLAIADSAEDNRRNAWSVATLVRKTGSTPGPFGGWYGAPRTAGTWPLTSSRQRWLQRVPSAHGARARGCGQSRRGADPERVHLREALHAAAAAAAERASPPGTTSSTSRCAVPGQDHQSRPGDRRPRHPAWLERPDWRPSVAQGLTKSTGGCPGPDSAPSSAPYLAATDYRPRPPICLHRPSPAPPASNAQYGVPGVPSAAARASGRRPTSPPSGAGTGMTRGAGPGYPGHGQVPRITGGASAPDWQSGSVSSPTTTPPCPSTLTPHHPGDRGGRCGDAPGPRRRTCRGRPGRSTRAPPADVTEAVLRAGGRTGSRPGSARPGSAGAPPPR